MRVPTAVVEQGEHAVRLFVGINAGYDENEVLWIERADTVPTAVLRKEFEMIRGQLEDLAMQAVELAVLIEKSGDKA